MLAGDPELGRNCDDIRPGLRWMEIGRHVVFYRLRPAGILVTRILHERMLPERYAIDEEDETPKSRREQ
jgi:toxin ParE1/3/4